MIKCYTTIILGITIRKNLQISEDIERMAK